MSLYIKDGARGARISGLKPEMIVAIMVVRDVFSVSSYDVWLTSGLEGKHSRGSKHYIGHAIDVRMNFIPEEKRPRLRAIVTERLGQDFDVVLEGSGANAHLHIEFDPKSGVNI